MAENRTKIKLYRTDSNNAPSDLEYGELAIQYSKTNPKLYFRLKNDGTYELYELSNYNDSVMNEKISSVQGNVQSLATRVSTVETNKADTSMVYTKTESDAKYALGTSVASLSSRVDSTETNISAIQNELEYKADESDVSSLEGRMTTAEGNISTLRTDVTNLGNAKQNNLTPGTGISISNNVISSTVSEYDDTNIRSLISTNTSNIESLTTDVNTNKSSISTLNGTGQGSITQKINDTINNLSGSATIATVSNDIITIKSGIVENYGSISNSTTSDVVLAKVAKTGSANDVNLSYQSSTSDVQTTITNIDARISTLENTTSVSNIVCNPIAEEIPAGAIYNDGIQQITGTMAANNSTMSNMYLVKTMINGEPAFEQYITVRSTTAPYTYSWRDIGSTKASLAGYAKSVTTNNQEFSAGADTTITLPNVITNVEGDTEISGGLTGYTSVSSTNTISNGNNTVSLETKIKTQQVSTATSSNNGIALANDVKDYVQNQQTIIRTYTEADI